MSVDNIIGHLTNEAILITIFVSLPTIFASLGVGLLVALFSATTQIQEATLSFAPKMIAVYAVIIMTGGWVSSMVVSFAIKCLSQYIGAIP